MNDPSVFKADKCVGDIMFSACPSVRASMRPCVRVVKTKSYQCAEYHQTLADDVVDPMDELIGF